MTKQEVYALLDQKGIPYEATEHEAVFHMAQLSSAPLPYPEADAKNLFVRDDKRQVFCLITVRGDKRVDLKAFRRAQGLRPLSFASPEELERYLELRPGSVTPLGALCDGDGLVRLYLDRDFCGGHCRPHVPFSYHLQVLQPDRKLQPFLLESSLPPHKFSYSGCKLQVQSFHLFCPSPDL